LQHKQIREFLDWVHERAVAQDGTNPGRTANKAREHLRAVLSWAWEQELIESPPRFPKPRDQWDVAGRHYLRTETGDRPNNPGRPNSPEGKPMTADPINAGAKWPAPASATGTVHACHRASLATLSLGALGVVFGDIGTSPLYTVKECLLTLGDPEAQAEGQQILHPHNGSWSPLLAEQVDQACDRFEVAWNSAIATIERPRIEYYLDDVVEPEHTILLRELASLDFYYHRLHGQDPQPADYSKGFPSLDEDWLADAAASRATVRTSHTLATPQPSLERYRQTSRPSPVMSA
jgi:hypothetical protein